MRGLPLPYEMSGSTEPFKDLTEPDPLLDFSTPVSSYKTNASVPDPPPMWARTDLDAFLLFEAANRGIIPIYYDEPPFEERSRLTTSGSVIVWDESALDPSPGGKKLRWNHTLPWSHSRMVRSYLIYRQTFAKRATKAERARPPEEPVDSQLEYDVFCALRDHENYPSDGLMRKTMTLSVNNRDLHLISFFHPYEQLNPDTALPTVSSLPQFAALIYDIHPEILRYPRHRRTPVINIVSYAPRPGEREKTTLPLDNRGKLNFPVYGGEWRSSSESREIHSKDARKYWARKLRLPESEVSVEPEDPDDLRKTQEKESEQAQAMPVHLRKRRKDGPKIGQAPKLGGNVARGKERIAGGKGNGGQKASTSRKGPSPAKGSPAVESTPEANERSGSDPNATRLSSIIYTSSSPISTHIRKIPTSHDVSLPRPFEDTTVHPATTTPTGLPDDESSLFYSNPRVTGSGLTNRHSLAISIPNQLTFNPLSSSTSLSSSPLTASDSYLTASQSSGLSSPIHHHSLSPPPLQLELPLEAFGLGDGHVVVGDMSFDFSGNGFGSSASTSFGGEHPAFGSGSIPGPQNIQAGHVSAKTPISGIQAPFVSDSSVPNLHSTAEARSFQSPFIRSMDQMLNDPLGFPSAQLARSHSVLPPRYTLATSHLHQPYHPSPLSNPLHRAGPLQPQTAIQANRPRAVSALAPPPSYVEMPAYNPLSHRRSTSASTSLSGAMGPASMYIQGGGNGWSGAGASSSQGVGQQLQYPSAPPEYHSTASEFTYSLPHSQEITYSDATPTQEQLGFAVRPSNIKFSPPIDFAQAPDFLAMPPEFYR